MVRFWQTVHRYLGVIIGLQLFLWTISGLIFSFSPIGMVRGEHLVREFERPDLRRFTWIPLSDMDVWTNEIDALVDVKRRVLLGEPVYEVTVVRSGARQIELWHASEGRILSPISADMAQQIALKDFAGSATVRLCERLIEVGPHSEYRGRELPAYRIELDHSSGTVVYVSESRGTVVTRRNTRWRWFDFFWMLHTMDYAARDNFNHWILKTASILGVSTVLSGFGLFLTRTRWFRRRRHRKRSLK